jgi:membrane associated rhomboid family serine protease
LSGRGYNVGFGPPVTPPIVKNIIIANVAVYVAQRLSPLVTDFGAVTPYHTWQQLELWRPFTYMWLHSEYSILHIAFNMFALWMFGSALALAWGEQRFLRYYLACGVGAGFVIATAPYIPVLMGLSAADMSLAIPTVGASGAVMGVLLAYSFTWPERTIMLIFPPIPIKAIWLIPLILFMELTSGPGNISHIGHLGGVAVGWIYMLREGRTPGAPTLDQLKYRYRRYKMRQKLRAVRDDERRDRRDDDDHTYH